MCVNAFDPWGQRRTAQFSSCLRSLLHVGRLFIVLFLLAELDCQSKLFFSSVAVFPLCNRRGALSQEQSKKTCLLQIRVQKWSKTGRNVSSKGFKTLCSGFKPNLCSFLPPLSLVCCLSSGTFDYIIVCNCVQTISIYIETNAVAKENNPVSLQPLKALASQSRLLK